MTKTFLVARILDPSSAFGGLGVTVEAACKDGEGGSGGNGGVDSGSLWRVFDLRRNQGKNGGSSPSPQPFPARGEGHDRLSGDLSLGILRTF